jgi:hypothetical protein
VFIYNPISMYRVLATNLSSLDRTTAMEYLGLLVLFLVTAGFLSVNDTDLRSLARGALLVFGGFLVSLLPILVTVPGIRTMGDQYYALLIALGSLAVLSLTAAMHAGLRIMARRSRSTQRLSIRVDGPPCGMRVFLWTSPALPSSQVLSKEC